MSYCHGRGIGDENHGEEIKRKDDGRRADGERRAPVEASGESGLVRVAEDSARERRVEGGRSGREADDRTEDLRRSVCERRGGGAAHAHERHRAAEGAQGAQGSRHSRGGLRGLASGVCATGLPGRGEVESTHNLGEREESDKLGRG